MELKLAKIKADLDAGLLLLIVPYGIETDLKEHTTNQCLLLIVPYGIETLFLSFCASVSQTLLIVPYGIETSY